MKREQGLPAFGGARGDRGFTLIELLVTIIILSVLLGLAIPGFSSWLPRYRLRGAARDIYSNLQYAKMTAVQEQGRVWGAFRRGQQPVSSGSAPGQTELLRVLSGSVGGDDVILKTVNFSEYGSGVACGHGSATQQQRRHRDRIGTTMSPFRTMGSCLIPGEWS